MSVMKILLPVALMAARSLAQNQPSPISLNPPTGVPQGASRKIDHTFASLAFEKSSFYEYAGNATHPNLFSDALVNILQDKVGTPLYIRIGGTSADEDHFNASQTQAVKKPNPPDPHGGLWGYSIGPSYFDSLVNFQSSKFIWMLPMAHADGLQMGADALQQSKLAINKIGNKLAMLELGNEPNLYANPNGVRPAGYDVQRYVKEALQHEKDIEGNVTAIPVGLKYQALTYDSGVNHNEWNTEKAFNANINQNGKIGSISWHYYQSIKSKGVTLKDTLMNHHTTITKLSRFVPEIRWLNDRNKNIDFVLGEVGSVIGPELKWIVQSTFGNALWTVDAMLYAMSMNVTRMHMQSGTGFGYAPWNTSDVRPAYYALAMVSDFIGNKTETGLKVKHMEKSDANTALYSGYENGVLDRMVLVNLMMHNATANGNRQERHFDIKVPSGVQKVRVTRLMAPGASSLGNVSWAGIRWAKAPNGGGVIEEKVDGGVQVMSIVDGRVDIGVKASEAALVKMLKG